jgi:RHS repeat-associated protein
VAYEYDALHRLTGEIVTGDPAGANGASSWTYDEVSNRLTQSSTLPGVAAQTFTHDANDRLDAHAYNAQGQTLADETGASYTWNFQNRLESKTGGSEGGDVTLVYNGDGQLVERTVDGVTTQFLVDDLNHTGYSQIVEEIVNGTVTVVYTYGHDLISQDRVAPDGTSWHVSFFGYDGHGSVRFLTDATGQLTDSYTYDAWGQHLTQTGTTQNPYRYAGERWLESLGLSYNRARMLSTRHGRFWSMDEWEGDRGQPVTLNKYLYGNGGPTNARDPSGYISLTNVTITVAIVAIVAWQFILKPFGEEYTKTANARNMSPGEIQQHSLILEQWAKDLRPFVDAGEVSALDRACPIFPKSASPCSEGENFRVAWGFGRIFRGDRVAELWFLGRFAEIWADRGMAWS